MNVGDTINRHKLRELNYSPMYTTQREDPIYLVRGVKA